MPKWKTVGTGTAGRQGTGFYPETSVEATVKRVTTSWGHRYDLTVHFTEKRKAIGGEQDYHAKAHWRADSIEMLINLANGDLEQSMPSRSHWMNAIKDALFEAEDLLIQEDAKKHEAF